MKDEDHFFSRMIIKQQLEMTKREFLKKVPTTSTTTIASFLQAAQWHAPGLEWPLDTPNLPCPAPRVLVPKYCI